MRRLSDAESELWQRATSDVTRIDERPEPVLPLTPPIRLSEPESPYRLDLHGMTVHAAHEATERFLAQAEAMGIDRVRVITGRSGQIRQEFGRWLDGKAMRSEVDRGGGSFVIRIKKR